MPGLEVPLGVVSGEEVDKNKHISNMSEAGGVHGKRDWGERPESAREAGQGKFYGRWPLSRAKGSTGVCLAPMWVFQKEGTTTIPSPRQECFQPGQGTAWRPVWPGQRERGERDGKGGQRCSR